MIISRSTHVAANGIISFFSVAEKYPIVCVYHVLSILSSAGGHLGGFHVLTDMNRDALNIGIHVSFQIRVFVFSGYICPGVGLL